MTHAHQFIYHGFSAMQIWKKIPVGVMAEVINDVLYVTPSPTLYHQQVTIALSSGLYRYVKKNKLGHVYPGPTDVFLDGKKSVVIPDINYVSNENKHKLDRKGILGAPDLLIEVYSPSTGKRDRTIKKALYEKMGVKEYWIVNPVTRKAEGFHLEKGRYSKPLSLTGKVDIRILNKTFPF
jgi:Uma2 family endonuclease